MPRSSAASFRFPLCFFKALRISSFSFSMIFRLSSISSCSWIAVELEGNAECKTGTDEVDPKGVAVEDSDELTGVVKTTASSGSIKDIIYHFLQTTIAQFGKVQALGWICLGIITAVLLKNLFLYLSWYFLAPIRNAVTRKYSKLLYDKILQLPIGYFTEQRKGDKYFKYFLQQNNITALKA